MPIDYKRYAEKTRRKFGSAPSPERAASIVGRENLYNVPLTTESPGAGTETEATRSPFDRAKADKSRVRPPRPNILGQMPSQLSPIKKNTLGQIKKENEKIDPFVLEKGAEVYNRAVTDPGIYSGSLKGPDVETLKQLGEHDIEKNEPGLLKHMGASAVRGAEQFAGGLAGAGTRWAGDILNIEPVAEFGQNLYEKSQEAAMTGWEAPSEYMQRQEFLSSPIKKSLGFVSAAIPSLTAGLGVGVGLTTVGAPISVAGIVGASLLALGETAPEYVEMRESGMSEGEATAWAAPLTAGVALLEYTPFKFFMKPFKRAAGKMLGKVATEGGEGVLEQTSKQIGKIVGGPGRVSSGVTGAGAEGLQESLQNTLQNLTAKATYDDARRWHDGLLESFIGGAGAGGITGFALRGAKTYGGKEGTEVDADQTAEQAETVAQREQIVEQYNQRLEETKGTIRAEMEEKGFTAEEAEARVNELEDLVEKEVRFIGEDVMSHKGEADELVEVLQNTIAQGEATEGGERASLTQDMKDTAQLVVNALKDRNADLRRDRSPQEKSEAKKSIESGPLEQVPSWALMHYTERVAKTGKPREKTPAVLEELRRRYEGGEIKDASELATRKQHLESLVKVTQDKAGKDRLQKQIQEIEDDPVYAQWARQERAEEPGVKEGNLRQLRNRQKKLKNQIAATKNESTKKTLRSDLGKIERRIAGLEKPPGVKAMITQKDKTALGELGYAEADINKMKPDEARQIIETGIAKAPPTKTATKVEMGTALEAPAPEAGIEEAEAEARYPVEEPEGEAAPSIKVSEVQESDVLTSKKAVFKTEAGAEKAVKDRGLADSHRVARLGQGKYVVRDNGIPAPGDEAENIAFQRKASKNRTRVVANLNGEPVGEAVVGTDGNFQRAAREMHEAVGKDDEVLRLFEIGLEDEFQGRGFGKRMFERVFKEHPNTWIGSSQLGLGETRDAAWGALRSVPGIEVSVDQAGHWVARVQGDKEVYFQRKKAAGDDNRSLYIAHNLSEENLRHALDIGGLAMPSLGIGDIEKGAFTGFGEISLIAEPDFLKSGKVKAFDADIYSPRHPRASYFIDTDSVDALNNWIKKDNPLVAPDRERLSLLDENRLEDRGVAALIYNEAFRYAFLKEKGIEPKRQISASVYKKFKTKKIESEFSAFANKKFKELVKDQKLFKGFTYAGNRRYIPYTLENVVKEMKREALKGGEKVFYGAGSVRASQAKEYKSKAAIKKDQERLVEEGGEEIEQIKEGFQSRLADLLTDLKPYYRFSADSFGYFDDAGQALIEGRRGLNETFENLPQEELSKIKSFLDDISKAPTEHFEAKASRAVDLGEFHTAVVPHGTSKDIIDSLKEKGIKIKRYKQDDNADRQEKIKSVEEVLFQRKEQATPGMEKDAVRDFLTERTKKFKAPPKMTVVQSLDDIKNTKIQAEIKKRGADTGDIVAVWQGDRVTFVADNMQTDADVESAMVHELFGHHGVEAVMTKKEALGFFQEVHDTRNDTAEFRAVVKDYKLDMDNSTDRITAAREFVARRAESGVDDSLITRLVGMVRRGLKKVGVQMELSDTDIRHLIAQGSRRVQKGKGGVQALVKDKIREGQTGNLFQFSRSADTSLSKAKEAIVKNASFNKWFGNSTLKDENGNPRVLFHGTKTPGFTVFDRERSARSPAMFFFTEDKDTANVFSRAFGEVEEAQPGVYPVYLRAENLFDASQAKNIREFVDKNWRTIQEDFEISGSDVMPKSPQDFIEKISAGEWEYIENSPTLITHIKEQGYDSVRVVENGVENIAVFEPNQIKSVYNRGTFNIGDEDIMFQRKGMPRFQRKSLGEEEVPAEAPTETTQPITMVRYDKDGGVADVTKTKNPDGRRVKRLKDQGYVAERPPEVDDATATARMIEDAKETKDQLGVLSSRWAKSPKQQAATTKKAVGGFVAGSKSRLEAAWHGATRPGDIPPGTRAPTDMPKNVKGFLNTIIPPVALTRKYEPMDRLAKIAKRVHSFVHGNMVDARENIAKYSRLSDEDAADINAAILIEDQNNKYYNKEDYIKGRYGLPKLTEEQFEALDGVRTAMHDSLMGTLKDKLPEVLAREIGTRSELANIIDKAKNKDQLKTDIAKYVESTNPDLKITKQDWNHVSFLYDWVNENRGYFPHKWKHPWRVRLSLPTQEGKPRQVWIRDFDTGVAQKLLPGEDMKRSAAVKRAEQVVGEEFNWGGDTITEGKKNTAKIASLIDRKKKVMNAKTKGWQKRAKDIQADIDDIMANKPIFQVIHSSELPNDMFAGARPEEISSIISTSVNETMKKLSADDKIQDIDPKIFPALDNELRRSMELLYIKKGGQKHLAPRKNIKGYRTDVRNVIQEYLWEQASLAGNRDVTREMAAVMKDIDPVETPRLWQHAKDYMEALVAPSPEATIFKRIVGTMALGFDVSAAAVNASQNFTHGTSVLRKFPKITDDTSGRTDIELYGGKADVTSDVEVMRATKHIAEGKIQAMKQQRLAKKTDGAEGNELAETVPEGGVKDRSGRWVVTPTETKIIRDLIKSGSLDPQLIGEQTGFYKNAMMNGQSLQDMMFAMFSGTEAMNRLSLALAAGRRALAAGKSVEEATDLADGAVDGAHFIYGPGNRPMAVHKLDRATGKLAVGSSAYTFMTYPMMNLVFIRDEFHDLLSNAYGGNKEAVKGDMKKIGSHLGYTMLLGGVTAAPFYGVLQAIGHLFGDEDDEDWETTIRRHTNEVLGRGITRGAPALLGVDLSQRIEGTDVWGTPIGYQVAQSYVERFGESWEMYGRGEIDSALFNLTPDFLRNPYKAGVGYDRGGEEMYAPPIKYSIPEALVKTFGFPPTRESEVYAATMQTLRLQTNRSGKIRELAKDYVNDRGNARKIRQEILKYNNEVRKHGRGGPPPIRWSEVMQRVKREQEARGETFTDRPAGYMRRVQEKQMEIRGANQ